MKQEGREGFTDIVFSYSREAEERVSFLNGTISMVAVYAVFCRPGE